MNQDLLDHLNTELKLEEGLEHFVYDDAKGAVPFKQGDTLVGYLTAATGVNLSAGLDDEEVKWLSEHRMQKVVDFLMENFTSYATLDEVRAVAIADIVFNLGTGAQQKWPNFFRLVGAKDWQGACNEIRTNMKWISQVHQGRAARLENMVLTGAWPTDIDYSEV